MMYKGEDTANVSESQRKLFEDAGWTTVKPEKVIQKIEPKIVTEKQAKSKG